MRSNGTTFLLRELERYRVAVAGEIERIVATRRFHATLGQLMLEYPLREGKGLRPALCLATCQACGGRPDTAMRSAAALELFHNAFLIHDDIEDESLIRRGDPTLVQKYGTAIAINVGDALNVLSVSCLLENTGLIGVEKSLRVFHEIEQMARESVEGQAMELDWIRRKRWQLRELDYFTMTAKKSAWYTCVAPCRIGAVIAGYQGTPLQDLTRFGRLMGIAFQIQDDLLNLVGDEGAYGKERAGDLWEGKRTLMLIHLLGHVGAAESERTIATLALPRLEKTQAQVDDILQLMVRWGSLDYCREVARRFSLKAGAILDCRMDWMEESRHKRFLREVVDYVVTRSL